MTKLHTYAKWFALACMGVAIWALWMVASGNIDQLTRDGQSVARQVAR